MANRKSTNNTRLLTTHKTKDLATRIPHKSGEGAWFQLFGRESR